MVAGIDSKSSVIHKNSAVAHNKSSVEALERVVGVGIGGFFGVKSGVLENEKLAMKNFKRIAMGLCFVFMDRGAK